jgi:branched-chain amino acid transport system permease protein
MIDLIIYVLQLGITAALISLAVSIYADGLRYVVLHVMTMVGAGAYVFALLTTRYEWSTLVAAIVGLISSAFIGLLCAEAVRSFRGDGLALATFGIGVGSFEIFRFLSVTGGVFGISDIPSLAGMGAPAASVSVALFLLILAATTVRAWRRSVGGSIVMAIGMDEWGALSIGAPLANHQRISGLLCGALAGLGGVYLASTTHFIEPRIFQVSGLLLPLTASIAGRGRVPWGVVLAACAFVTLSQAIRFVGLNATVAGPLTEILLALVLAATLISTRLHRARNSDAAV